MSNSYSNNKALRSGIVLTIIALITILCMCATFAKYITNGNFEDQARVAKWGLGIKGGATSLFDASYNSPDDSSVTVEAANGKDHVIAPGTEKSADVMLISVTGNAPEVMYDFDVNLKITDATAVDASSSTIAKLDQLGAWHWWYSIDQRHSRTYVNTHAELEQAINALSKKNVPPNSLPGSWVLPNGLSTITVGWVWEFDNEGKGTWDKEDTLLGNMAANGELDNLKVDLNVSATQSLEENVDNVTVSFDTQGGSKNPDAQIIKKGQKATEPADPVKEGYRFLGWVDADGNAWDFDEEVNESKILYADWEFITYTLSFMAFGCDRPAAITGINPNTTFTTSGNTLTLSDGQTVTVSPDPDHRGTATWAPSSGKIEDDKIVYVSFEEKADPDIDVPTATQVVDADGSIDLLVYKQSDASWDDPSSSDPTIATAEWTYDGHLQINGLLGGDASITVSVPTTDTYKAGSKTISVHVLENSEIVVPTEPQLVDADSSIVVDISKKSDAAWNTPTSSNPDIATVKWITNNDVTKLEIDASSAEGTTTITVSVPATAKYSAGSKTFEVRVDIIKREKRAAIEDASWRANTLIKSIEDNTELFVAHKETHTNNINSKFDEAKNDINNATTVEEIIELKEAFQNYISQEGAEVQAQSIEDQFTKNGLIANIADASSQTDASINDIDNLTQNTKDAYIAEVDASAATSKEDIQKAYNSEAAEEVVKAFTEDAQGIYQRALDQAQRQWEATWDPSKEVTVEQGSNVGLDASAYVMESDPYHAQAPDASYSLDSAPEGFTIDKGEGDELPYIYVSSDVEPGEYTLTAIATFVAVPDCGAETSIKVDNIKVTVTSSIKHKSLYRSEANWTYAPVFVNGKGAAYYGLHFYDSETSTEELEVNSMMDLKDRVGQGDKSLYYEIDENGGQQGDGKLYAIRSTSHTWNEIKSADGSPGDADIKAYNLDDAFGDHWVGLDWDDMSVDKAVILIDKNSEEIHIGGESDEGSVCICYGRPILSFNTIADWGHKSAGDNSGYAWNIHSGTIFSGVTASVVRGVLFSRAFD